MYGRRIGSIHNRKENGRRIHSPFSGEIGVFRIITLMTLKEIAKLAGVSPSTVSKIINNKADNMNPGTIKHVLDIVKKYNYSPYGSVRSNNKLKSLTIGVLLRNLNDCNREILDVITVEIQKNNYNLLFFHSHDSNEEELRNINTFCKNGVDAVIWEPVNAGSLEFKCYLDENEILVHLINTPYSEESYCFDYFGIGYQAVKKMAELGHTSIACVLQNEDNPFEKQFHKGALQALYENDIPANDNIMHLAGTDRITQKLFSYNCTAIVCFSLLDAYGIYRELEACHVKIPGDISMLALSQNSDIAAVIPELSVIRPDFPKLGQIVCRSLIAKLESSANAKNGPRNFFLPFMFSNGCSISTPPNRMNKKIVVVGSINTDITLNGNELPEVGKTIYAFTSSASPGGKGINQAIGVSRLGMDVTLIGKVGDDYDSAVILNLLKEEGVNTQAIGQMKNQIGGKAYIYVPKDAESTITIVPGANQFLTDEDTESSYFQFGTGGYCLISTEIPVKTAIYAAKTAKENGMLTIIKPSTLDSLPKELLLYSDLFIPNEKEGKILCPKYSAPEEQAEYFRLMGADKVIITLGSRGCYVKTDSFSKYYKPAEMQKIDSTGGADAFIAALSSYLIRGYTLDKAIVIATYAAAFCISRVGVVSALTDRNSLELYIQRKDPCFLSQ